jgi:hypothetical protein
VVSYSCKKNETTKEGSHGQYYTLERERSKARTWRTGTQYGGRDADRLPK